MDTLSESNLILFPGIAADERTFHYMRPYFPNLFVPRWLPLEKAETLDHYVQRLCESIPPSFLRKPFYLGGHSFGGVLAQEIAAMVEPEALFLISSFRTHRGISPLFKAIEWLTRPAPHWLIALVSSPYRYLGPRLRRGEPEKLQMLVAMYFDTPLELTRWGARCATCYLGPRRPCPPIYQIHGSDDPLLPVKHAKPDAVIKGGTHIIPITHAREVAQFIAAHLPAAPIREK